MASLIPEKPKNTSKQPNKSLLWVFLFAGVILIISIVVVAFITIRDKLTTPTFDSVVAEWPGGEVYGEGGGVRESTEPAWIGLTAGREFSIKYKLEILDDINPDLITIYASKPSYDILESMEPATYEEVGFEDTYEVTNGNTTVTDDGNQYILTNFKPGDIIEFSATGICPETAELHGREYTDSSVYGDVDPESIDQNAEYVVLDTPTGNVSYSVAVLDEHGWAPENDDDF